MSAEAKPEKQTKNLWEVYERRKAELPADLESWEYEKACREIADELGI